ncbi:FMN-dependent NADH-azoreductase [Herbaspirillum sp. SJZ099]|uniref:FMN-dependent NADH-azoreductase n=1 Tax=Herbaspirillum sp. SJZ099 TaxID=2572916 RepID=UPI0011A6880B|nr:NAD(P)H-dependent oxidoreductase [Herbaspirillum sp. SJZ099]TWC65134.1 FMN-dependent NADH-azoreductase [Herbaspirillum sp. SJZ099]
MQILHLDSSILGPASASRVLSAAVVEELLTLHPAAQVNVRDLAQTPIAHLDGAIAAGFRQPGTVAEDAAVRSEHALSETLVSELLASDVIVLGVPMYNFSVPSQLKAWLDRIAQPGRTFRYTETGPIGLSGDKAVIVTSTRGGMYSSGPAEIMDHQESYLKAFFGFLGIQRVRFVRAELLTKGAELRSKSMREALDHIPATVAGLFSN